MFLRLIILFSIITFGFGDDSQVQISGTNDKCAEFCSKTYPAHTFDHSSAEDSCKQGCRLFTMIQFNDKMKSTNDAQVNEEKINTTDIISSCEHECNDAYSDEIFKRACIDGCGHQIPSLSGEVRVVIDGDSPLFPFANKLINDAVGKFDDFKDGMRNQWEILRNWLKNEGTNLASSVDTANGDKINNDDAKIVNPLQSMHDRLVQLLSQLNSDNQDNKDQQPKSRFFGGPEDVGDHLPNHGQNISGDPIVFASRPKLFDLEQPLGPSVGNEDENGEPIIFVKMIPLDNRQVTTEDEDIFDGKSNVDVGPDETLPTRSNEIIYVDADDGWLACLSRRAQKLSMMSRWLLSAALMMSILCMFWLCLALMRNQRMRRRRMYTQYRAGKSDAIYFMPPPSYEKSSSAAYLPLNKDQTKAPPSPPPAYRLPTFENVELKLETELPKSQNS